MARKITTLIMVMALLLVGGLGGFLFAGSQPVKPSAEHQAIVDTMMIKITKNNFLLEPKCVDSGTKPWGTYQMGVQGEAGNFMVDRNYEQSTWLWQRHGDTELAMTIWGPGEDQSACLVELGRLGADPFTVILKGEVLYSIPQGYEQGYLWFIVDVT